MIKERLFLSEVEVDLPQKKVSQTYQINSLAEIQDRQKSYTNRFFLPNTPKNVKAMEFLGISGNNSRVPYIHITARYSVNGIDLMPKGYAVVRKTRRSSKKGYDINIYDGTANFYETIKGRRLNQLNYDDLNHHLNATTYEASYANTEGYIYGLGFFGVGGFQSTVNIERQAAALYRHTLWGKIFAEAGFTYSGNIFQDPEFLKEVVTPAKGYDSADASTTETAISSHTSNTIVVNELNLNDPIFYDEQFTLSGLSGNKFTAGYDGVLKIDLSTLHTLYAGAASLVLRRNGNTFISVGLSDGNNIANNKEYSVNVITGDVFTAHLEGFSYEAENEFEPFFELSVSASCSLSFTQVAGGIYIDFALLMPETSQKDFIKDTMHKYGMIFQPTDDENHYEFITMEELLNDRDNSEDWSSKLVTEIDETYKVGSYAQNNYMKYLYEDDVIEATYDGRIDIDNVNLQNDKTLFTSITKISNLKENRGGEPIYTIPLWADEDGEIKILESVLRSFKIKQVNGNINISVVGVSGSIPYSGDIPHLSLENVSYDYLKANHYDAFEQMLNKQVVKNVLLDLSVLDIYKLNFLKLKFFRTFGQYYYLEKVSNYVAGEFVKARLIEVQGLSINESPTRLGTRTFNLINGSTKVLTLLDFTNTVPAYQDPEYDQPEKIKVISGFNSDVEIYKDGVLQTAEFEFDANNFNVELREKGVTIPEHTALFAFKIQSFNNPNYSVPSGELDVTVPTRVNYAPNADAGGDRTIYYDSANSQDSGFTYVNGCNSSDPNGNPLTYIWEMIGTVNADINLVSPTLCSCRIDATNILPFGDQTFQMRLTVDDGQGATDNETITITLLDLTE